MFCPQCGSPVAEGTGTCPVCGFGIADPASSAPQAGSAPLQAAPQPQAFQPAVPPVPPQGFQSAQPPVQQPVPLQGYWGSQPQGGCPPQPPASPQGPSKPGVKRRTKVIIASAVAAVVVLCAVAVVGLSAPEFARSNAYAQATSLYEEGSDAEAQAAYEELGDYREAQQQITLCKKHLEYERAAALMDAGDYAAARDGFRTILGFQDATELSKECGNIADYAAADALLAEGKCYDAYEAFTALGSYEDAAERAASCIQEAPGTGELYHDQGFVGNSSEVAITAPAGEGDFYYLKVYQGDAHVSSIFFGDSSVVTIELPPGSYQVRAASGSLWFGEADLFGDSGSYSELGLQDGSGAMTIESGYRYELSVESSFFFGSSERVARSSF